MSEPNWATRTTWTRGNQELLSASCNSLKGDRTQAGLIAAQQCKGVLDRSEHATSDVVIAFRFK